MSNIYVHLAQVNGSIDSKNATLLKALRAFKIQDYSTAHTLLTEFLSTQAGSQSYVAYEMRAVCLLHCQRYQEALDDAMAATKLNPTWCVDFFFSFFSPVFALLSSTKTMLYDTLSL